MHFARQGITSTQVSQALQAFGIAIIDLDESEKHEQLSGEKF